MTLLSKAEKEYTKIAGEPIKVEQIASAIYVYGSELATLRLFRAMPSRRQGYSENLKTFYFCVELEF